MNVKLLRRIKKHILEEPKRLEMGVFCEHGEPGEYLISDGIETEFAKCGTAACIAGWASILSGNDQEHPETFATRVLELKFGQAARLFYVDKWPKKFATPYENAKNKTQQAKVASARIDHFIATKGK